MWAIADGAARQMQRGMGMTVDEARVNRAAIRIDDAARAEFLRDFAIRPDTDDARAGDGD
jgi:Arc/MetJ family transcription regulator